jgi:hypothetical protein
MIEKQKGFSVPHISVVLVVISIVSFTGWYVWNAKKNTDAALSSVPAGASSRSAKVDKDEEKVKPIAAKHLSDDWLLRESSEASIRVPDGFEILINKDDPVAFWLPDAPQGTLKYRKGTQARVMGEPHKHFELGIIATYNKPGFNDLGTYHKGIKTYSNLDVEVKLYEQKEVEGVPAFTPGSKYLKYTVKKDDKYFNVDYVYLGEGITDIVEEMVKSITIN